MDTEKIIELKKYDEVAVHVGDTVNGIDVFSAIVESDSEPDGTVTVRVSESRPMVNTGEVQMFGRRYTVTNEEIYGHSDKEYDEEKWNKNKKILTWMEEAEKAGHILVDENGSIRGSVQTGMTIVFRDGDDTIKGVIEADGIHDGCVSAIAISKNYCRRYEVPVADIAGTKYSMKVKRIGKNLKALKNVKDSRFTEESLSRLEDILLDAAENEIRRQSRKAIPAGEDYLDDVWDRIDGETPLNEIREK